MLEHGPPAANRHYPDPAGGDQWLLTVTTFRSLSTKLGKQLREEADRVADLRGASAAQVEFERAPTG